jgi:translation initiation factor IF-2
MDANKNCCRLEENGGDVQCVAISALKGTNVRQLVEAVLTLAEVLELRCDTQGKPEGTVIESQVRF